MPFEQKPMKVTTATYDRVTVVKLAMAQEKGRPVTYSEAIDYLITYWEETAGLASGERRPG